MNNKLLRVLCEGKPVGRLAMTSDGLCAFEYAAAWLADGFAISPFKLPLAKKVFVARRDPFGGGFGVFNDSLPDGWGRLLIDRLLVRNGRDPAAVSTVDRLAIVGKSGMGALEYEPDERLTGGDFISDLPTLEREAAKILASKESARLDDLVRAGGSSGGARPKALVNIDGESWIVKFRAGIDPKNIGKIEFAYSQAARTAGIEMPETRLFNGKYFGVRRFDRKPDGGKVFMISVCALLDASHRYPTLDYNDLMTLTLDLTRDFAEAAKMFRLMCFNVFAHNRDDHSKNFAFLREDGGWRLSPAFDLTCSEGMGGEHATTIDGEGRNPSETHILSVARKAGMDAGDAVDIMNQVRLTVKNAGLGQLR